MGRPLDWHLNLLVLFNWCAVNRVLLIILCYFAEAQPVQLSGVLIVDVDANTDVQVFWSIFGGDNRGVNITYTVSEI